MRYPVMFGLFLSLCACAHTGNRLPASVEYGQAAEPTADHGHMHMRGPAPDVDCEENGWSETVTPAQQQVIDRIMADRSHRLHHALWHAVRGGLSNNDQATVVTAFGGSWNRYARLCPSPQSDFNSQTYNPAGEDFLYMHHDMVNRLRAELAAAKLQCIRGWSHVPTLKEAPLPDRSRSGAKSADTLALLSTWDRSFQDPAWLKSHSLSQVGWALEHSIHNNLHMRYATELPPKGFDKDGAPITLDGKYPADWTYDSPSYNWLADPYGAAVNPTFWKIHGYVDSIITKWLTANDFSEIKTDCQNESRCYQWKGTWTGDLQVGVPRGGAPRADAPVGLSPADAQAVAKFTRRRLDLQKLGVLKDSDFHHAPPSDPRGPGPVGASPGPSKDPFEYTRASLCPGN